MEAPVGEASSTTLLEPDAEAVLEAACCSEILLHLGDLAALTKRASTVFRDLNEQARISYPATSCHQLAEACVQRWAF